MWNLRYTGFLLILFIVFSSQALLSQHVPSNERGDPNLRRKTDIDGNNVRATIFNSGLTGRSGVVPGEIAYEWPKNSQREHVALTAVWMGAEFDNIQDIDGRPLRVVDVMQYRTSPDGSTWNFEPIPGYNDPNYLEGKDADGNPTGNRKVGIAKSNDPWSWPPSGWADKFDDPTDPGWIGSWNGFFGKDIFNADQELFFKLSDDLYDRKLDLFQPDNTDLSRGGLGVIAEVRVMAWSQILINDVVFVINNFTNDGTTDLEKVGFAIWLADVIGNDTQNDRMNYDLLNDLATMDDDEIGWGSVGVSFLETPGNSDDRIDNDGDGNEVGEGFPKVTEALIDGEIRGNYIDDNQNGLIDEDTTHVAFGTQEGVSYADRIDADGDAEENSPVVTTTMISQASIDRWERWPPNPEEDDLQAGIIHLLTVSADDEGSAFADGIDNNDNGEEGSDIVTQAMIDMAANDFYLRYRVPGTDVILYDLGAEDLGRKYADGIDNDNNGIVDEFIDEGIDEMIDESRDDGLDNDGDWDPVTDDVGLDGVESTGDFGENDGKPTSGSGTPFPGEPNIDKTDISESDQLGITNVQRFPAGTLSFGGGITTDAFLWLKYIVPGEFWRLAPGEQEEGENDLTVASSLFPMDAGNTERMSYAVILGENPQDVLQNREKAQETYNADYQFAKAPGTPTLRAVPGNNQITLYWDSEAENSFDNFLAKLGLPAFDFEGYRLYRAQDPAFEDAFTITDGQGARTFRKPIAQWDLVDGIVGFDSVGVNGVSFFLGEDNGLKHAYVDTDVRNGFTYYYALTSFDFGAPSAEIAPAESPILITIDAVGNASLGQNVVKVVPSAPVAGYLPPEVTDFFHVSGSTSGILTFEIVDPRLVKEGNTYQVTFEDTLIRSTGGISKDTLTTKSFTLVDVTSPAALDTLVFGDTAPFTGLEAPLANGIRLLFENPALVQVNLDKSSTSRPDIYPLEFEAFRVGLTSGTEKPADYRIEFGDVGFGTSTEFSYRPNPIQTRTAPAIPVNFKIRNLDDDREIAFGFLAFSGNDGVFDADSTTNQTDIIAFLEEDDQGELQITWSLKYQLGPVLRDTNLSFPTNDDNAEFILDKPFLASDVFEFTTKGESIDQQAAANNLDDIKVVPNPYLAASRFETFNPFTRGRGPRQIRFTHLPQECTIRIYTVNGELVDTIEHNSALDDGSAEWDLLTKDNLDVAYGIYIYHVEAPGVGAKTGKFAIIK